MFRDLDKIKVASIAVGLGSIALIGCNRHMPDSGVVVGKHYLGEEKVEGASIKLGNCFPDFSKIAWVCERYRETFFEVNPESWVIRVKRCREELFRQPACGESDIYVDEEAFNKTQPGEEVNVNIGALERVSVRQDTDRKRIRDREYSLKLF